MVVTGTNTYNYGGKDTSFQCIQNGKLNGILFYWNSLELSKCREFGQVKLWVVFEIMSLD